VKAEATSTCQACGARVPAGLDFCPVCALLRAGGNDSAPSEALNPVSDSQSNSAETETASTVRRFENYEVMLDQDGQPIELGRGAMGITYKGFDTDLRFPVTLKVISEKYVGDESARLRFLREARAAAKVRHPNVASVFHLGRSGGEYFYAMEFVEGETLESLMKRSGQLAIKMALEITSQIAAGLEAIHEQKLVHRDIKPTNIMVRLKDEGRVTAKIIDLGLAKGVSEPGSQSAISTPGAFAGTPEFASPEQFAGLGLDIRSDLYSVGVTLWEMLVGQAPYRGSPTEVMYQHQHGPLPLEQLRGLPRPVVVLLEVLLDKDPAQRIQSPAELLKATQLVTAAIDSGRSLTAQDLRAISSLQLTALQKIEKFSERLKALFTTSRVRLLAWTLLALLIAGLVFLTVNVFFGVRRLATESPVTPPASIKAPDKSIAVLPFESLSENKSDTYFAAGVQDEILSKLAKLSQLKVISRTSVMAYRPPSNRDVRSIGTALGVAHLVEGTVQRDGNRVRITTELIDARTDETLWSESYQRDLTDIFAIQSEIAQTVASKLSTRLSPEEQKSIGARPTTNLEAYDLYLQAKELVENFYTQSGSDILKASKLLEEATRKDPKFTLAYCLAATAHDDLYAFWIDKTPERRALADAAVDEALRLEPDSPDAHLALAYHLYASYRNYERASVQIALAQRALPNSSDALFVTALIDFRLGRWEDAINALEKAYGLDPRNPSISHTLGWNYLFLRHFREAEQFAWVIDPPFLELLRTGDLTKWNAEQEKTRAEQERQPASKRGKDEWAAFWDSLGHSYLFFSALDARDWTGASRILAKNPDEDLWLGDWEHVPIPRACGEIYLAAFQGKHPMLEGRFKAAREELARRVLAYPDDVLLLGILGEVDALLGRKQEAIEEATRAARLRPISQDAPEGAQILGSLAMVYTWTNEPDLAFQELAILIKTPPLLPLSRELFASLPQFDPIRKDPRFDKLVAQIPRYQ
jgi:serine/threonine protein kinase/Flp pilus assembly protein TadD